MARTRSGDPRARRLGAAAESLVTSIRGFSIRPLPYASPRQVQRFSTFSVTTWPGTTSDASLDRKVSWALEKRSRSFGPLPQRKYAVRRQKLEAVRVEPEDAQQPGETREDTIDDPLQGHARSAPVLQLLRREQLHRDEDIRRCHDLAVREQWR